jgi:hypothetical protein
VPYAKRYFHGRARDYRYFNSDHSDKRYLLNGDLMARYPVRSLVIVQFNERFGQSGEIFWINRVDDFFLCRRHSVGGGEFVYGSRRSSWRGKGISRLAICVMFFIGGKIKRRLRHELRDKTGPGSPCRFASCISEIHCRWVVSRLEVLSSENYSFEGSQSRRGIYSQHEYCSASSIPNSRSDRRVDPT